MIKLLCQKSTIDRTEQKNTKDIDRGTQQQDQQNLVNIYRTHHPTTAEYTVFASAHRIYTKIYHQLDHLINLTKFKRIEMVWSVFSGHNVNKLQINNMKITEQTPNFWKLSNTLLNNM